MKSPPRVYMRRCFIRLIWLILLSCGKPTISQLSPSARSTSFNKDWKVFVGNINGATDAGFDDSKWRILDLPHDGSIEGKFDKNNPSFAAGGFLPGGVGFYRKTFQLHADLKSKLVYVDFDGIYRNSEVWINGHYLGKRPNGYISFRYELTDFLQFGEKANVLTVKVDNEAQPNSRWYTGSGITRNVWLTITNGTHVGLWGVHAVSEVNANQRAKIHLKTTVIHKSEEIRKNVLIKHILLNEQGNQVSESKAMISVEKGSNNSEQEMFASDLKLWSPETPNLYVILTQIIDDGRIVDEYRTSYGFRYFHFDPQKGFILNGRQTKIKGVSNHSELGCLGGITNKSAYKRQLKILKEMGCNAIRTAHNPPPPELLDLCDEMGFIVMDEAFDVWKSEKNAFDYHWNWDEWHKRDLEDLVKRDRNHPSIMIWSIGNEIPEQTSKDNSGSSIALELRTIIRSLDTTRPITAGNNYPYHDNQIIQSGALDLIGVNYHENEWQGFPSYYPGKSLLSTETVSGLQTRGEYTFPSDKLVRWNDPQNPVSKSAEDFTCSSFDQEFALWGITHEQALKNFKKYDFVSGVFVWSGFDYLGEPTPYYWPARSSFFGINDLAGFPKDIYYLYQSEWTTKPVLHLFPHWNWTENQMIDLWAYYNNADEVELFLNGTSLGSKRKVDDALHVMWRIPFHPGTLKIVSRKNGKNVLSKEVKTAGPPVGIRLSIDKNRIHLAQDELCFVKAELVDADGIVVPNFDKSISFEVSENGLIMGVDNGNPIAHDYLKGKQISTFHGMALVVLTSKVASTITLRATARNLVPVSCNIYFVK